MSREISANCRALGDRLQGVCHDALQRLPAEDGLGREKIDDLGPKLGKAVVPKAVF